MHVGNTHKAFTLIETLIVVAILSVLAAVALPAYSDFVTRAKICDIIIILDKVGTAVSEYHALCDPKMFPNDLTLVETRWNGKYGTLEVIRANNREGLYGVKEIKNVPKSAKNHYLYVLISYSPQNGYRKQWITDLPRKFRPRQ